MNLEKKNRTILWKSKILKFSNENGLGFREIERHHFSLYNSFFRIDFYPHSSKYHDVKNNKRGVVVTLEEFLKNIDFK